MSKIFKIKKNKKKIKIFFIKKYKKYVNYISVMEHTMNKYNFQFDNIAGKKAYRKM